MIRKSVLQIDLEQIHKNALALKSISKNSFFCPMLKAKAYGHGEVPVAKALSTDVDFFGLALYEEALVLRKSGIDKQGLLVFAPMNKAAVAATEEYQLQPVIVRLEDLQLLESNVEKPVEVHIKFDTSMHRLGLAISDLDELNAFLKRAKKVKPIGYCTHFAKAEDIEEENSSTLASLKVFDEICQSLPKVDHYHALNSSALLHLNNMQSPYLEKYGARPGIALYGAWPSPLVREAMTIKTHVLQIHLVKKGEGISYGHIWTASQDSLIGVLPIGYADGIRRSLTNSLHAKVRGKILPIVGRICMDYIFVNLTDLGLSREELLNEEVILLDASVDAMNTTAWANSLNTIPYEVMTSFSERLSREYL